MKKVRSKFLRVIAAVATMIFCLGMNNITVNAAFNAPYYNINVNGGSFNGNQYTTAEGIVCVRLYM